MNTKKRFIIDGILLLGLTIIILCNLFDYLVEHEQRMAERESYVEDKQFFMKSSFAGVVLSKKYSKDRYTHPKIEIQLYKFDKLRYNYSYYKYDFTKIRDSIATLYFDENTYNRIQVGDTIEKERDSLSVKINTVTCDFYK